MAENLSGNLAPPTTANTTACETAEALVPKVTVQAKTPDGDSSWRQQVQPPFTPGRAKIPRIPSPSTDIRVSTERIALQRETTRLKNPHNAVRMSTVTMSAR